MGERPTEAEVAWRLAPILAVGIRRNLERQRQEAVLSPSIAAVPPGPRAGAVDGESSAARPVGKSPVAVEAASAPGVTDLAADRRAS